MYRYKIAIFITILACFFVEVSIFDKLRIFGTRPELLLILTFFFGFHFGIIRGIAIGLVSGILKDIFSITTFGLNTFSFLLLGALSSFLKDKFSKDNFIAQFLFSNMFVYIMACIYFLYLRVILQNDISTYFWKMPFYKGLYTSFLAPPVFFIFANIFNSKEI